MGRSQESFNKKEVRKKKEKKRQDKEKKRLARKEGEKKNSLDDMIAYVDENGMITDTPPDPASMILFAVPMLVLYLLGVAVAWVFRKRDDGAEDPS